VHKAFGEWAHRNDFILGIHPAKNYRKMRRTDIAGKLAISVILNINNLSAFNN